MAGIQDQHPDAERVEVWFQDEARVGQKGSLTHLWAPTGTRPTAVRDHRFKSAYIFGAVCPERDTGVALVVSRASTEAMNLMLTEISQAVGDTAHAAVLIDGAGWHTTNDLVVPANITLVPLPPYSPELNSIERLWQVMRDTLLPHRLFTEFNQIIEVCCTTWNSIINQPARI